MAITKEQEANILRYHFVEKWGVNTIASQLSIHHSAVDRVLSQAGLPKAERAKKPSILDPYTPFIIETLEKYPKLTAARLYGMAVERGYTGCSSHFRSCIAQLRPRKSSEAYLRLKTLPGEEIQVDWGHFQHVQIGRAKRPLMAFVMVLSWSRQIFLRFYLNQRMENFIRGHVAAFEFFGGQAKVLLYDNLKSAVLERRGDAIRFHPTLLELAAHYRFEPRPVAVARGNEKGRVERAIRYIRDNFFAARQWKDLDDLNAQAHDWCINQSAHRSCPEEPELTVRQAFEKERPRLIALPDNPYPTLERMEVHAGKTPYVRFDLNDYSVPHTYARKTLTIMASLNELRVLDGELIVATHPRSYGKGEQIENAEHIDELINRKRKARHHRGQDQLAHAAPSSPVLLELAAQRGHRLSTVISLLQELLGDYGAAELEIAIAEAVQQQVSHPGAVRQVLERRREQRNELPPIAVPITNNDKANGITVRPASLASYDQLGVLGDQPQKTIRNQKDTTNDHND